MATLKIRKVTTLPATPIANTLYFLETGGVLHIYLTDSTGNNIYTTQSTSSMSSLVLAIINGLKGQPNGLASLDANSNLVEKAGNLEAQDGIITAGGTSPWNIVTKMTNELNYYSSKRLSNIRVMGLNYFKTFSNNSNKSYFNVMFVVPLDYKVGTPIVIRHKGFVAKHNSNSGDVVLEVNTSIVKTFDNTAIIPDPTPQADLVLSLTSSNFKVIDTNVIATLSGPDLAPGSHIFISIRRNNSTPVHNFNKHYASLCTQLCYQFDKLGTKNIGPTYLT